MGVTHDELVKPSSTSTARMSFVSARLNLHESSVNSIFMECCVEGTAYRAHRHTVCGALSTPIMHFAEVLQTFKGFADELTF